MATIRNQFSKVHNLTGISYPATSMLLLPTRTAVVSDMVYFPLPSLSDKEHSDPTNPTYGITICHPRPACKPLSVPVSRPHVSHGSTVQLQHSLPNTQKQGSSHSPGIHLLINGFATYIRWSASPQQLQHPCEWPTVLACIRLQTFSSASHRPQLLRALLLSGRVTARSWSAPRVCLLCLQSSHLLRSRVWPFSVIPLAPST